MVLKLSRCCINLSYWARAGALRQQTTITLQGNKREWTNTATTILVSQVQHTVLKTSSLEETNIDSVLLNALRKTKTIPLGKGLTAEYVLKALKGLTNPTIKHVCVRVSLKAFSQIHTRYAYTCMHQCNRSNVQCILSKTPSHHFNTINFLATKIQWRITEAFKHTEYTVHYL